MWREPESGATARQAARERGSFPTLDLQAARHHHLPLHLPLRLRSLHRARQAQHSQLRAPAVRPGLECRELAGEETEQKELLRIEKKRIVCPYRAFFPFLFHRKSCNHIVLRIPSLCVGASLDYIERNPCSLPAGEEVCPLFFISHLKRFLGRVLSWHLHRQHNLDRGRSACCRRHPQQLGHPRNLLEDRLWRPKHGGKRHLQCHVDCFKLAPLRTRGGLQARPQRRMSPLTQTLSTTRVLVRFILGSTPQETTLWGGLPSSELWTINLSRFDQKSQVLLEATRRIKAQNNLTDLEAGIGLRNDFNSDTNSAIRERSKLVRFVKVYPSSTIIS